MAWTNSGSRHRTSTTDWKKRRRRILNRDHHTCQQCGHHDRTDTTLAVDHIINWKSGGTDDDNNLQVLCNDCHATKTSAEGQAAAAKQRHARHQAGLGPRRRTEQHPGIINQENT